MGWPVKFELDYRPEDPGGANVARWDSAVYIRLIPETPAEFSKCEAVYEHHTGIQKFTRETDVMYVISLPSKTHRQDDWKGNGH